MAEPAEEPAAGEARLGSLLPKLLGLAWPIIVSRSAQVVIGVSDVALVGRLGDSAIAATAAGGFNAFAFFIFPMGIVFVVSSFASQLTGAGDAAGARRYGWYGLVLAAATQGLALAGLSAVPGLLAHLPYKDDVRQLMEGYLRIRLLSAGAAVGMEALANYYGGVGRTRLPMIFSLVAMALNVVLNVVFVFGKLGAPALGVRGAALASTVATSVAFVGLLAVFVVGGARRGEAPSGDARPRLGELWRLLRFGLPSGANWFFEFAAFTFFINVVVAGLGTTTVAATMAVLQVNSISFMPAFGVASAGAILVGQAIGAGRRGDVPRLVRATLATNATWQGLVALVYVAAAAPLMRPFVGDRADAAAFLASGARLLALSSLWQLFDGMVSGLAEALRAAGDTAFCLWARLAVAWLIFVPEAMLTVRTFHGGEVAAMLSLVVYLGLLAAVLGWRFRGGAWRRIDLVGKTSEHVGA